MPFERATLTVLRDDTLQDYAEAQVYDTTTGQLALVTMFEHSPLKSVGYGTADGVYSAYGYLDWIALQAVPWTAENEFAIGWGGLKGVTRKPAAFAAGGETISGTVIKTDIPAGTLLSRTDGTAYATLADAMIGSGLMAPIAFEAVVSGAAGNAAAGTILTFQSPITGLPSSLVTVNPIVGGADLEAFDSFKARYLQRYAEPPAGGARSDYIEWAEEVPGVTRAWCNPNGAGAGTVVVYVMLDDAEAGHGGFPQGSNGTAAPETRDVSATGDQLVVADHLYPLRPVTALVYVCTPIAWPVVFTLANLGTANTATNLAAIQGALDIMFLRLSDPLGGAIYPNAWEAAINALPGVPNFTVTSPAAPLFPPVGYLPVRGTVTIVS